MSNSIESNAMKYKLIGLYQQNQAALNDGLPEVVNQYRKEAIREFDIQGLPAKGDENYKYTNLMAAFGHQYGYSFNAPKTVVDAKTVFQCAVPDLDTYTLLIENGWYYEKNDEISSDFPKGVHVMSFKQAASEFPELFEKYYNKQTTEHKNSIASLNTAFAKDGLFLYIEDGVVLEKPIQIINLLRGNNNLMVNQRNLIIAGKNSQAKVIVCDHTLSNKLFLSNTVTEVFIDEDAIFDYYSLQNQHNHSSQITSLYIHQKKNSYSHASTLTLHGGFVRNNIYVKLAQEHSQADVYGLSLVDGKQHVDNFTFIDHAVPNCNSNEMYKNILDDDATGAFNGRILVREDAQKTQAFQSNKNVLLTDTARFYTKPQLEIYADDVKCTHGATVGQIDEEAQFYLQSRGIGGKEARMMLMYAFAYEIIEQIRVPVLTERYGDLVEKRLRGEFSRCEGCFVHCQ